MCVHCAHLNAKQWLQQINMLSSSSKGICNYRYRAYLHKYTQSIQSLQLYHVHHYFTLKAICGRVRFLFYYLLANTEKNCSLLFAKHVCQVCHLATFSFQHSDKLDAYVIFILLPGKLYLQGRITNRTKQSTGPSWLVSFLDKMADTLTGNRPRS